MDSHSSLKIVMLPWLAMGHLIPFLELSKSLAKKGVQIFFITTPKNIERLPNIPTNLQSCINLISIPLPHRDGVPDYAESSMDVIATMQPLLKSRFDLLEPQVSDILEKVRPDWIVYDFTSYWIPPLAAKVGASCAFFALFSASTLSFFGSPAALLENSRTSPEDFTVIPDWVPFESDIVYRFHEVMKFMHSVDAENATPDTVRFGQSIKGCDVVALRSSSQFEPTWVELLGKLYEKVIIPIGFLFPDRVDDQASDDEKWSSINKWLDSQVNDSVLYVALGSESCVSQEEINELALGLELSDLPFLMVVRNPPGSSENVLEKLPKGFIGRVSGRGLMHLGWAPQVKILSHPSTKGFLTHCGWNSVIEGVGLGRVLVLLPIHNDQGLVARLFEGKGLGVEIARDKQDGSFRRDSVASAVRLAMVDKEGETLRANARKLKGVFGDRSLNDTSVDNFFRHIDENRKPRC